MNSAHPATETLVGYASGGLKTGARLVVGMHLKVCAACRREVARLESIGGAFLEAQPEAPLAPHALDRAMAALDQTREPSRMTLEEMSKGLWTPIGLGTAMKPLRKIADPGEQLYLIRAEGGRALPEHGHTGIERLVVIAGALQDEHGRFGPGDLVERGPGDLHRPVACEGETCLCLAATEGPLKLSGLARLAQVFLRI